MSYNLTPFNTNTRYPNQVKTELNLANDNFTLLGQAFLNNDPTQPILRAVYINATAPSNPVADMLWYDTTTNILKLYDGSTWKTINDFSSLNTQINTLNSQVNTLNSSVSNINTQVNTLYSSVSNLNTQVNTLNSSVSNINTQVNTLDSSVSNLNTQVNTLKSAFFNNDPTQPILRATYIGTTAPSNPVAGTTWLDTSLSTPTLKIYDGSNWRVASSSSSGGSGGGGSSISDADTVDGFHASLTPAPDTIIPLNDDGILDLSSTYVKSNVYTFRRVDLTNATEDYMLQVGEEAIINFTNTATVPLHIATQSGTYYEMYLVCSNTGGTSGAGNVEIYLNPNNTTYSNAFIFAAFWLSSSSNGTNYTTYSAFRIGWAFSNTFMYITNFTQYKNIKGISGAWGVSGSYPGLNVLNTDWRNTTTPWTSLGTVSFPQTSSGYILVRRLV